MEMSEYVTEKKEQPKKSKKTPKDEIYEFIAKRVAKEKDKWMSGMKSNLSAWEDTQKWFINADERIESLTQDVYDLTFYKNSADSEIKHFKKEYYNVRDENIRLAGQLAEFTATVQSQKQMLEKLEKRLMNYEKGRYDS